MKSTHQNLQFSPDVKLLGPAALLILALTAPLASAAVIGHWRFEEGTFQTDSSAVGNNLTTVGTAPVRVGLPATGAGSDFPNPIPQSGDTNESAASFGGSGNFTTGDHPAYNVGSQLTAEFFFNPSITPTGSQTIVGQFLATGNQRSWVVMVNSGQFRLATSHNGLGGGDQVSQNSTFDTTIVGGTDYYGAMVFDAGLATFYLRNLTTGQFQTSVVGGFSSILHDSTADLTIGSFGGGTRLTGLIDEVRISNTALSSGELMIVPEPTATMSLGVLMMLGLMGRRRPAA